MENTKENIDELLRNIHELSEMYQSEVKRYKNLNRQLRTTLNEMNELKDQFKKLMSTYDGTHI